MWIKNNEKLINLQYIKQIQKYPDNKAIGAVSNDGITVFVENFEDEKSCEKRFRELMKKVL